MNQPINILYDASLLGIAYRNQATFGLSRTTENLLTELIQMPDVQVMLSSDVSYNVWLFVKLYLQHQDWGQQFPLEPDAFNVKARNFIKELCLKDKKFQPFVETLKRWKIVRHQGDEIHLYKWREKVLNYRFCSLTKHRLRNVQIYHSNYHKIPSLIQSQSQICMVLTVHDLIPILYPEWCGITAERSPQTFHPEFNLPVTLEGLTPNHWIICPSQATQRDLLRYYGDRLDPKKITVIPWAASSLFYPCSDPEKIAFVRQKYRIPKGAYLLGLNTLEPRKNMEGLIQAFYRVLCQEENCDLSLVLAGKLGWQYETIFEALKRYPHLVQRVVFPGYIQDEDLAALYSDALVFCYPSFYEGFGLPPLEAMQCGTPVITSPISSLPEVVGDGGILVNPHDPAALAQAILDLYRSPALRQTLAQKSLARAKQFTWRSCGEQTVHVYREAWRSRGD